MKYTFLTLSLIFFLNSFCSSPPEKKETAPTAAVEKEEVKAPLKPVSNTTKKP